MTLDKKYLITGVDPELYKDFKTACAYYGITAKATLIKHMENIVKDYWKVIIKPKPKRRISKKGVKKK